MIGDSSLRSLSPKATDSDVLRTLEFDFGQNCGQKCTVNQILDFKVIFEGKSTLLKLVTSVTLIVLWFVKTSNIHLFTNKLIQIHHVTETFKRPPF